MKKVLLLSICTTLISNLSFATIRRVGYAGIPRTNVDYATVQAAHDAASNNDTIQIYGATSGGSITKPLVFIGFGYNFDANTGLQAIGTDAPSSVSLSFLLGSSGSIVQGCSGSFNIGSYNPNTGTGDGTPVSNITFQRCNGTFGFYNYAAYGPISNIKIISCVVQGGGMQFAQADDYNVTNAQLYNCILQGFTMYKPGSSIAITNCVGSTYSGISLSLHDAGAIVKNCIFPSSNSAGNINTVYESNFFAEAAPATLPPGTNNRWGQVWANIFTRNGGTDDLQGYLHASEFDEDYYTLKTGSPAKNGGFNLANQPTDCGIFGGEAAYVYKISGVPPVPSIYKLTAPGLNAGSNPYNVTISVRSNN